MGEDDWLEAAYEDRNGCAAETEFYEDGDELPCPGCNATPGEACYIDCPETPGRDEGEDER